MSLQVFYRLNVPRNTPVFDPEFRFKSHANLDQDVLNLTGSRATEGNILFQGHFVVHAMVRYIGQDCVGCKNRTGSVRRAAAAWPIPLMYYMKTSHSAL
jgi:hypothetical protein